MTASHTTDSQFRQQTVQTRSHSAFTLSSPRNKNCLNPMASLI